GLLIQKNIFNTEKLRKHLNNFLMLGKLYYREEKGIRFLESLLRYLSYASDITYNDIEECTRVLPEPGRKVFMTLAEQLIEQGVEQGIEQGVTKGELIDKQNVLIKQISRKFGILDMERTAIKETENLEILDSALDIILFAETKAEVMETFYN
ncbi:MAG: hypothetical protein U9N32_10170, partial [Spirochaetota bacterium]|nr:hypothetical protein [Spirochaetota bacterium]